MEDLVPRIAAARELVREKQRLASRIAAASAQADARHARLAEFEANFVQEEEDVERLEGWSLAAMFASIAGSKDERLAKEREDVVHAKLARDACADALLALEEDIAAMQARIDEIGDADARLAALLTEKETRLRGRDAALSARIDAIDASLAGANGRLREIDEATQAADDALVALRDVARSLDGAAKLGTWDMLGGGMIVTHMKHGKLDEARAAAHAAQRALDRLEREAADVDVADGPPLVVEIAGFTRFADFFFDGLFADWAVQSKIGESRRNVDSTDRRVREVRAWLVSRDDHERAEIERLAEERRGMIESA